MGDPTGAMAFFELALDSVPDHRDALYGKGTAFLALGDPEQALEWFERTLRVDPYHKGRCRMGPANALLMMHTDAMYGKGNAHYLLGPLRSIEFYDAALAMDPAHIDALYGKCRAL